MSNDFNCDDLDGADIEDGDLEMDDERPEGEDEVLPKADDELEDVHRRICREVADALNAYLTRTALDAERRGEPVDMAYRMALKERADADFAAFTMQSLTPMLGEELASRWLNHQLSRPPPGEPVPQGEDGDDPRVEAMFEGVTAAVNRLILERIKEAANGSEYISEERGARAAQKAEADFQRACREQDVRFLLPLLGKELTEQWLVFLVEQNGKR